MTPLFVWLILALAAYRLWRLLALDTILDRPRTAITDRAEGRWWAGWAEAIYCPWCLGFWCCLLVFGAVHLAAGPLYLWPLQAAAASTLVGLIGAHADG